MKRLLAFDFRGRRRGTSASARGTASGAPDERARGTPATCSRALDRFLLKRPE